MPKPTVTIYLFSVLYNGITWDEENGGPQSIQLEYGGQNIPFRSGNDEFPVFNPVVDKELNIVLELSEYQEEVESGVISDMVIKIQKPDESLLTITYPNIRFIGSTATQPRANYASRTLRFTYQAATGLTDPLGLTGAAG